MKQLFSTYPKRFWVACAGVLLAFIGLFGPWVDTFLISASGLDTDDGKVLAVAALIAGGALVLHATQTDRERKPAWPLILALLAGLAITGIAIYDWNDINDAVEESEGLASVGWGIYLDVIAGVVVSVACLLLLLRRDEAYGKRSPHAIAGHLAPAVTPEPAAASTPTAPAPAAPPPAAEATPTSGAPTSTAAETEEPEPPPA